MERKLQKNELALWKEITKDDIKINDYISEEMTQKKNISIKKRNLILKKHSDINKEKNNLVFEKTELKENTFQVNKRMKAKLGRGLIRPRANLDLHGYNRVEARKTLKLL